MTKLRGEIIPCSDLLSLQVSAAHPLLLYLFLQGTAASHQKLATLSVNPGEETNPTPLKRSSWQPRMVYSPWG